MPETSTESDTFTRTSVPCTTDAPRLLRAETAAALADCPRLEDAILIVSELATNAVRYSSGGDIGLTIDTSTPGRVRIEVTDSGRGKSPRLPVEPDEHGRGLVIVAALANDDCGYDSEPGRSTRWAELTYEA